MPEIFSVYKKCPVTFMVTLTTIPSMKGVPATGTRAPVAALIVKAEIEPLPELLTVALPTYKKLLVGSIVIEVWDSCLRRTGSPRPV